MTYQELADKIQKAFTPLAFSCDCDSESCRTVREENVSAIVQERVTREISEFIRSLEGEVQCNIK